MVVEGLGIGGVGGEERPSKGWVGEAMCEARAPAVPQAVAVVVPAEEAVVAPVQGVGVAAAVVGVAAAVVVVEGDAGKAVSIFRMFASEGRKMRHLIAS